MPDPNTEHGLRVQLATALRERDEQKARAEAAIGERDMFRLCVQNEKENAAKEREGRDAEWRAVVKADREALAAARRECEGLREFARSVAEYDEYRGDDEDEDPPLEILARIEAKARAALGDSE